jgi:hypothetical protein
MQTYLAIQEALQLINQQTSCVTTGNQFPADSAARLVVLRAHLDSQPEYSGATLACPPSPEVVGGGEGSVG